MPAQVVHQTPVLWKSGDGREHAHDDVMLLIARMALNNSKTRKERRTADADRTVGRVGIDGWSMDASPEGEVAGRTEIDRWSSIKPINSTDRPAETVSFYTPFAWRRHMDTSRTMSRRRYREVRSSEGKALNEPELLRQRIY